MTKILWGGPEPAPTLGQLRRRGTAFWDQYASAFESGPRLRELEASSLGIVEILPDPQDWGNAPNPFKGLVVGAVQSGKTASMIGVSAVAIDQGFKIVIVLAGLKDDLRRQTARRFNSQLLRQNDLIPNSDGMTTLPGAAGPGPIGGYALPYHYDANFVSTLQIQLERTIRRGEPCVLVVKKNNTTLLSLASALKVVYRRHGADNIPTIVLDDECDEASVVSGSQDQTIPTAIRNLWRTAEPTPLIAYVGYTATAAASLLQDTANELFPSHFVHLLRYPAWDDNHLSYQVPEGDGWYSGSQTFFQDFGDETGLGQNFLPIPNVDPDANPNDPESLVSLNSALRAYFVSGAMRLCLSSNYSFNNAAAGIPKPHTMMVQTSTSIGEHRDWRDAIAGQLGGTETGDGIVRFDPTHGMRIVENNEDDWESWFNDFEISRLRVHEERPHQSPYNVVTWEQVKAKLPEVFEHTKLRLVNSDQDGGSTLDYNSGIDPAGNVTFPPDSYTIAVGGTKLSRGLTLEGLCISYYTRDSETPYDDVTLQSSRWFGYRGPHLEFCRVFTTEDTYARLEAINRNDLEHRERLAKLMEEGADVETARIALRSSPSSVLTAKIGIGTNYNLAFSPFTHVFDRVEADQFAEANETRAAEIVEEIKSRNPRTLTGARGHIRGIYSQNWRLGEVADLLDEFDYSSHNPDPSLYPFPQFYRDADDSRPSERSIGTNNDPYILAAYLRYWASLGSPTPAFNVGVTFGDMDTGTDPFEMPLLNRKITSGRLDGAWSGSSGEWRGDALFDDPPEHLVYRGSLREAGAYGLLLLHIIHKSAKGRSGTGTERSHHTPVWGAAIPSGGPDFSVVVNYQI